VNSEIYILDSGGQVDYKNADFEKLEKHKCSRIEYKIETWARTTSL